MSKIVSENASEEFLYSLSNYCELQVREQKPLLGTLDMMLISNAVNVCCGGFYVVCI